MNPENILIAPIAISTYSRLKHLKQTIEALRENNLAERSDLYIFSDAPKKGDEKKVNELRQYIRSLKGGFKNINIVERRTNGRVFNSRDAMYTLLLKYGKMIFLEDDIITAPNFLTFINEGLEFYKDNQEIISISGYTHPIFPPDADISLYLSKFFSAWGFGCWANKTFLQLLMLNPYFDLVQNSYLFKKIYEYEPYLDLILKSMDLGLHEGADYKLTYFMIKNDLYQIRPTQSLVKNVGWDGSGEHCGTTNLFDTPVYSGLRPKFSNNLSYNRDDDNRLYNFLHRKIDMRMKIRIFIARILRKLRIYV